MFTPVRSTSEASRCGCSPENSSPKKELPEAEGGTKRIVMRTGPLLEAALASSEFWVGSRPTVATSETSSVLNWSRCVTSCSTSSARFSRNRSCIDPPLEAEIRIGARSVLRESCLDGVHFLLQGANDLLHIVLTVFVRRTVGQITHESHVLDCPGHPLDRKFHKLVSLGAHS